MKLLFSEQQIAATVSNLKIGERVNISKVCTDRDVVQQHLYEVTKDARGDYRIRTLTRPGTGGVVMSEWIYPESLLQDCLVQMVKLHNTEVQNEQQRQAFLATQRQRMRDEAGRAKEKAAQLGRGQMAPDFYGLPAADPGSRIMFTASLNN